MENVVKALVPVAMIVTAVALVVKANREASKNKEMIRQCDEQRERVRKMFAEMNKPNNKAAEEAIQRCRVQSSRISNIIEQLKKGCPA